MNQNTLFDDDSSLIVYGKNILPKDGEAFFFPGYFNKEDSDRLFKALQKNIQWKQDEITLYGKKMPVPRLSALYGDENLTYTYSGILMKPHPWTPELLEIKNKIEEDAKVVFTTVLLNLYRDGKDSVAWHCDDEPELGTNPVIGSVSFGATRTFKFRHLIEKTVEKVELNHGSYVLMKGETQHKWEHEIPKTTKVLSPRINLTFRVIR